MTEQSENITLTRDEYNNLVKASIVSQRPGILTEMATTVRKVAKRVNYHLLYSGLLTWELIFYDKHAADQSPDSLVEIIKALMASVGGA